MKNLDRVLKSRNITLPAKVCIVKAMVFPVVMYGWETWTIKKTEHWSIDAFELWCWRRLLRVSWTAQRSNKSILKEVNPEYSLEDWFWNWSSNTLATWWEEVDGGWNSWMGSLTHWTWVWPIWEIGNVRKVWHAQSIGSQRVGHDWAIEQQQCSLGLWCLGAEELQYHEIRQSRCSAVSEQDYHYW